LVTRLKQGFAKVQHIKPKASRQDSAEVYVLATGFRGGM
jgi:23S rRNA (uridine2552-2'-O)-methyltransferase